MSIVYETSEARKYIIILIKILSMSNSDIYNYIRLSQEYIQNCNYKDEKLIVWNRKQTERQMSIVIYDSIQNTEVDKNISSTKKI
jgi:hypothetical protein